MRDTIEALKVYKKKTGMKLTYRKLADNQVQVNVDARPFPVYVVNNYKGEYLVTCNPGDSEDLRIETVTSTRLAEHVVRSFVFDLLSKVNATYQQLPPAFSEVQNGKEVTLISLEWQSKQGKYWVYLLGHAKPLHVFVSLAALFEWAKCYALSHPSVDPLPRRRKKMITGAV